MVAIADAHVRPVDVRHLELLCFRALQVYCWITVPFAVRALRESTHLPSPVSTRLNHVFRGIWSVR